MFPRSIQVMYAPLFKPSPTTTISLPSAPLAATHLPFPLSLLQIIRIASRSEGYCISLWAGFCRWPCCGIVLPDCGVMGCVGYWLGGGYCSGCVGERGGGGTR